VAVTSLLAVVLGHTVIDSDLLEKILNAYAALAPLIAGFFIRPAVTPNAKVVAYAPDPVDAPNTVVAGEASDVTVHDENAEFGQVEAIDPPTGSALADPYVEDPDYNPANDNLDGGEPEAEGTPGAVGSQPFTENDNQQGGPF